jgi:hypothetical protein
MPQIFKIGSFWVYFWANENEPLEPVHVHISKGGPKENATKVWITRTGKCLVANNNSHIPDHTLRNIIRILEARNEEITNAWIAYFGEIRYFI